MADQVKLKMAVSWAAACGGCDVAILDTEQQVLALAELVDFVFWPVAMDFKRADLCALPAKSVDVGLYNGAVRTSEQEHDAHIMREKCKVLVAFGSCACFGGIPGLANEAGREAVLETAYKTTPSTDNPGGIYPQERVTEGDGVELTLPAFSDEVRALHQVVDVDVFAPGCPPVTERIIDLVGVVAALARGEDPPPAGTFLASRTGLCRECPRGPTRGTVTPQKFVRPHEVEIDPTRCLLDQGLLCMGIATRGGCGAKCIRVNMPCRGCYGPVPGQLDPGAELVSALATLPGPRGMWETPVHQVVTPATEVRDPLGTFYRFTYPVSVARRNVADTGKSGG